MPDLQFGYFLTPDAADAGNLVRQAQLCDRLGLSLIGVQDHPYQSRFLDTWTLISVLAAQTEHIRFFPDVANLPLRPPAMLAKAASTLDILSGGRVELGLGAGAFWQGVTALGGPSRTPGEAVEALEEAIQIIRLLWSGQRGVRYQGQHYQIKGAHAGPEPAHRIEIWIGAVGPRMLGLTGRLGDGWIPSTSYVHPDQLAEKNRIIDEAAQEAGRAPGDIRRMYNLMGRITGGEHNAFLVGPVEHWVEAITRLITAERMDTFIFAPQETTEAQIRLFAEEVVPQVRRGEAS